MGTPLRLLILEDNPSDAELMTLALRSGGYDLDHRCVDTEEAFRETLEWSPELILADYSQPRFDALQALAILEERDLDIPLIVVTGVLVDEAAVECLRLGASDYLLKDRLARLAPAVQHALEQKRLRDERRRALESLRLAEARYRTLIEQIPAVTYISTLDETRGAVYASPQVTGLLGFTPAELLARKGLWIQQLHPDDQERFLQSYRHTRETGEPFRCEYRMTTKDGRLVWVRDEATVFQEEGDEPVSLHGVVVDISEWKRAEEEVQRLNQDLEQRVRDRTAGLEAANEELGAFNYAVSHDLRSPLLVIASMGQVLDERYRATFDEHAMEYLSRIRDASKDMEQIIDGLLRLSEVTADERIERVDLSVLARSITRKLQQSDPERAATFTIADGLVIKSDPRFVAVVLGNLMENAWKYTQRVDHARIEFSRMTHPSEGDVLYIRDNGVGFDMTKAEDLFRPFYRGHGGDYEGYGIGLATVRRAIRRNNGKIWGESVPGQGATFYFTWRFPFMNAEDSGD